MGGPPAGGPYRAPAGPPGKPTPTEAIVALVLSISTMMTTCFPLGLVGMYYGHKARQKGIAEGDKTGEVLGLVAMILGGCFGGIWLLFWAAQILIPLGLFGFMAATEGLHH
jgi:hypothetical protein